MNRAIFIWLIIALVFISTGCSSMVKAEQPAVLDSVVLNDSHSVGQSFNAHFDGLNGVEIYLEPQEVGNGEIQLILREAPQGENLGGSSLLIAEISNPGYYHFQFPVQAGSNQQSYYLLLRTKGAGSVKVGAAPGNYYLDGALYQNGHPDDQRQMAFQLSYYTPLMTTGFAGEILIWAYYLLVAAFLFILPGWALLSRLCPRHNLIAAEGMFLIDRAIQNPITKLIISIGISLAIYPILFVWTDLFGLHLGLWYAWLPPIAGSGYLIWHYVRQRKNRVLHLQLPAFDLANLVLLITILLIIATRFWVIRSLPLPLWGDSYHHTMITQLMIDNNGLFNSWQPYADANTFTYHFGFHAIVSVFHWITNLSAAQATLVIGQITNFFAVLVLYPLAMLIFKNKWSGIVALLVAGLLSPMPMFYVNWGRYTQLAGQVFLLVAVWFTWMIFKTEKFSWRLLVPTWMVIGSLAITHYRVVIFYIFFIIAYLILHSQKKMCLPHLKKIFWIGIGAGLIFLPWFVNVFGGRILRLFKNFITKIPATAGSDSANAISYSIGDLTSYLPISIWLLVILILAISLWQKKMTIATIGLWWFMLVLVANPHWFQLPGKGIIDNFAVFIAAYIPAGIILAAIPTGLASDQAKTHHQNIWVYFSLAVIITGLAIWGSWQRHGVVNPHKYAIATTPDILAAKWIKENTSSDTRFLANAFFAYADSVIVGSDGGWWLPLIADRQTTLPPMTYSFESEPFPGYSKWVQVPTRMIEANGITHSETIMTLVEYGVTHVYIGQQQGSVNYTGPLRLNPTELQSDPHFEALYHQDRVWIFKLIP